MPASHLKPGMILHRRADAPIPRIAITRPDFLFLKSGNDAGWSYSSKLYKPDGSTYDHSGWMNTNLILEEYEISKPEKPFTRRNFIKRPAN